MSEFKKLNDRVAIVTGGAGGIGKEICKCLIGEGAKVVMADLSEASATTGPLISVPFVSPSGVINTAALSSKQTLTPFNLRTAYFCLTMTAP